MINQVDLYTIITHAIEQLIIADILSNSTLIKEISRIYCMCKQMRSLKKIRIKEKI